MRRNFEAKCSEDRGWRLRLATSRVVFLAFVLVWNISVKANGQVVAFHLENATLEEVFQEVRRQLNYTFVYDESVLQGAGRVDIDVTSGKIDEVMTHCLAGTSLEYLVQDRIVIVRHKALPRAAVPQVQMLELEGVVKDAKGTPMPGVSVVLKGTTLGVATDIEGKFKLQVPETETVVLEVSFIGYAKQDVAVKKTQAKTVTVVLEEEDAELEEVVVTGIFSRKKEGYTGSSITIKGDDIKKMSTTNIAKALSTMEPSFRIMDNIEAGSDPNRLPDLRMRGSSTLPAGGGANDMVSLQGEYDTYPNQPLLILDGFEIDVQTMVDLDPDRVASITLLKDASATAIYGSKAANGVIVIETYTPKEGEINVSYGGNIRFEMPDLSAYNLMNAEEKIQAEWIAGLYRENDWEALRDYQSRLREVKRGVDTYWLSKPLRTAVQHRHAVTLEGGSQALRYKLYVGMNQTPGVMKESRRSTQTISLDLAYRYKKLSMKNSVMVDNATGDNSPYGSFSEYTRLNPYLRPYGAEGEIVKVMQTWNMSYNNDYSDYQVSNPLYNTTFNSKDRNSSFTIRNLFKLEYKPVESLRLQADFSVEKTNGKNEMFKPGMHTDFESVLDPTLRGQFRRENSESFDYELDLTASYNGCINSVHYLTGNLRYSIQQNRSETVGVTMTGFPNDKMDHILFGKKYNENPFGMEGTSRAIGFVGTFGYSYNYKYSVDFNIRVDGSSQFGSNNRFAPFWSAGAKWNLKKENFLQNVKWLDDVNLSTTYGITGSQGFAPYQAQSVYTYNNLMRPYLSSDATGTELVALGNTHLKWQQTATWNVRAELSVLEGRLTARAEYYRKITKNSLAHITLAPSLGFSSFPENLGKQQNTGVELNFSFIPYRNRENDAYWIVTVNGAHNVDKLVEISQALKRMNELNSEEALKNNKPMPRYQEGESQTRIWVMRSLGIDPATGDEILVKRDGTVTSEYDPAEVIPFGDTEPKWQGNINTSFNYKGFGLNLAFNYKFGGQVYNQTLVDKVENADLRYNVDKRVLAERWQKPGDKAQFKRLTNSLSGANTEATSRFVMDENTLRMGTLSLTYRMDATNTSFLKKSIISSLKWGFTMEDVFYLSSVKQERGLNYPFARQCAISLNIVFK